MSVLSDFKKRIKKYHFIESMNDLGFTFGPKKFWFYRVRDDFIDTIKFQFLDSGRGLRISISTYIPIILDDYDMSDFPKGFFEAEGNITRLYLTRSGIGYGGGNWQIASEDQLKISLTDIVFKVKDELIPWFDKIDSKKSLYDSIHDDFKRDEEFGDNYKVLLME